MVLPNAVQVDDIRFDPEGRARVRMELGIPEDAFVIGCVSRFHPKKRNDVVVDAAKLLDDSVHAVMGDLARRSPSCASSRVLSGGARTSYRRRRRGRQCVFGVDVSVFCPSPTEGAPRAVILAMLAERPVLATGKEGVTDLIADGAVSHSEPENDPAPLARALAVYAGDPELRFRHGRSARLHAEARHDAGSVAAQLEERLEAAVRGEGASR